MPARRPQQERCAADARESSIFLGCANEVEAVSHGARAAVLQPPSSIRNRPLDVVPAGGLCSLLNSGCQDAWPLIGDTGKEESSDGSRDAAVCAQHTS